MKGCLIPITIILAAVISLIWYPGQNGQQNGEKKTQPAGSNPMPEPGFDHTDTFSQQQPHAQPQPYVSGVAIFNVVNKK